MATVNAELRKLLGLPSAWAALVIGCAVAPVIAFITASATRRSIETGTAAAGGLADAGYQELAFGVVGAIILGVVAVSSEYLAEGGDAGDSRQLTTSLVAQPSRSRFLIAKASALILTVAVFAAVTGIVTQTVTRTVLGDHAEPLTGGTVLRLLGVTLYWVCTALIAYAITLLTRSGVVPLTVLILNTSVVSVTYLISKVVPAANYFPDLAGARMFIRTVESTATIAPVTGGLVMVGWTIALLTVGSLVFLRRDA
jgi:ABC-2 type transport system permease protein